MAAVGSRTRSCPGELGVAGGDGTVLPEPVEAPLVLQDAESQTVRCLLVPRPVLQPQVVSRLQFLGRDEQGRDEVHRRRQVATNEPITGSFLQQWGERSHGSSRIGRSALELG